MAMLEIKDIHKTFYTYDDKPRFHIGPFPRGNARRVRSALHVLNGVDLSVEKGDVVAILGPSGSGKTTLLRCLNFLETADSGTLVFDGESFDLGRISRADIARLRKKTAFVFQNYNLFRNKTALQNVTEGLIVARKLPKEQADEIGMKMLAKVGLADRADYYPRQLSGGQQQRAALARILVGKPRILMLDEPFSALDSYLREEVEGEVGSLLANFAGTALLVTHNRDEAYRLCREMIVMDSGEVLRAGTTKEVFADPRTRAAARLTGCKNILPCTRVGEHTVHLAGWEQPLTVALPVPEGCRAVGIRAHDFAPCAPGTPNSLPVQAVSTSENPFDWNMIFTLPGGETRLWWKVSKETLAAPPPKAPACLAAAPENIMPLV